MNQMNDTFCQVCDKRLTGDEAAHDGPAVCDKCLKDVERGNQEIARGEVTYYEV